MKNTLLFLLLFSVISCDDCAKYKSEVYNDTPDPQMDMLKTQIGLINEQIKESDLETLNFESYRMLYLKSLTQQINFIRIDNRETGYFVTFKDFTDFNIDLGVNHSFHKTISKEQWNDLEEMIYNHHFWTSKQFIKEESNDGIGYILQGRRPQAAECGKKTDQILFRGSPLPNDEIGQLGKKILDYCKQL